MGVCLLGVAGLPWWTVPGGWGRGIRRTRVELGCTAPEGARRRPALTEMRFPGFERAELGDPLLLRRPSSSPGPARAPGGAGAFEGLGWSNGVMGLSEEEFRRIVEEAAKYRGRIVKVVVDGFSVSLDVATNSKKGVWKGGFTYDPATGDAEYRSAPQSLVVTSLIVAVREAIRDRNRG